MKKLCSIIITIVILLLSTVSYAHSGRTDGYGGHYVRTAGHGYAVGSYHYHSGPYAGYTVSYAGEIPAAFNKKTTAKSASSYGLSKSTIIKIQNKLNKLGFNCGKADGIIGTKTKAAIKNFQKKNKLTVNGIPNQATRKKLGIK